MTPFGLKVRELRERSGTTLKELAQALEVSSAYLSALEHGKRGRPSWYLVQRIINYFQIIWDDAEELAELARLSHPRITIDTSELSATATELANKMSDRIAKLDEETINRLLATLETAATKE